MPFYLIQGNSLALAEYFLGDPLKALPLCKKTRHPLAILFSLTESPHVLQFLMGTLLPSQISSADKIMEDEKEPVVVADGLLKENGSYGDESLGEINSKGQRGAFFLSPLTWIKILSKETHWSFVFGVIVVYGISQGLGGGTWRVAVDYYWKDVQLLQPSAAQVYQGIIDIPWIVKPIWGLLTDVLPMAGYQRKPYLIFAGLLGFISMLVLSLHSKLYIVFALLAMIAGNAGLAIADVAIDACIAKNSIAKPSLSADIQSLCGLSSSIGSLVGFSISGILIHAMGSQGVLGLLCIPFLLVVLAGILIKEFPTPNFAYHEVLQKIRQAGLTMWSTMKNAEIWRPCVYMYISFALSLNIQSGMFYWYTNPTAGPAFSQESVGFIFSIGSAGALIGVLLYQNLLKGLPFSELAFLEPVVVWLCWNARFGIGTPSKFEAWNS